MDNSNDARSPWAHQSYVLGQITRRYQQTLSEMRIPSQMFRRVSTTRLISMAPSWGNEPIQVVSGVVWSQSWGDIHAEP